MKKRAFGILALSALAVAALAAPVGAASAVVINGCPEGGPAHPLVGQTCDIGSFDGSGNYLPELEVARYKDVIEADGTETETFKGVVENVTGHAVTYDVANVPTLPGWDGTCYSLASGRTTPDWAMTISASGNYSLVCHFPAVA